VVLCRRLVLVLVLLWISWCTVAVYCCCCGSWWLSSGDGGESLFYECGSEGPREGRPVRADVVEVIFVYCIRTSSLK